MIQVNISPQSFLQTGIKVEKEETTKLKSIQEVDRFFTYLNLKSLIIVQP